MKSFIRNVAIATAFFAAGVFVARNTVERHILLKWRNYWASVRLSSKRQVDGPLVDFTYDSTNKPPHNMYGGSGVHARHFVYASELALSLFRSFLLNVNWGRRSWQRSPYTPIWPVDEYTKRYQDMQIDEEIEKLKITRWEEKWSL